jgi:NADPH2:quinone reductase
VISTAVADGRLERLHEFGMDHGIDYTTTDVPTEVMRITDGRGVDLVVDPAGGRALEGSIASLAYRGRISWMGNAGGATQPPNVWPLMEKNGTVTTVFFAMEQSRQPERTHELIAGLIERVGTGELRAVVAQTFPLADAAEAHRVAETGEAFGRIVLIP